MNVSQPITPLFEYIYNFYIKIFFFFFRIQSSRRFPYGETNSKGGYRSTVRIRVRSKCDLLRPPYVLRIRGVRKWKSFQLLNTLLVWRLVKMECEENWKKPGRIPLFPQHLKGSPGRGILFASHGHLHISAYSDADWAGSPGDRRSTTGYCTLIGGNLVP